MFFDKDKLEELEKAFRERYVTLKDIRKLIQDNEAGIREYNSNFLPKLPMMGASALFIALIVSFFHTAMASCRLLYFVTYIICCLFFVVTRRGRVKKFVLPCLYMVSVILFILVIYLSIVKGRDFPGAAVLIMLSVFPVLFIDKPFRFLLTDILAYFVHSYLAYVVKGPELGQIDMVNGFIATLIGCFLGWFTMISRLRALDLERLLVIEKETDALTGLNNRRKLFETIAKIEEKEIPRPSGVMMLDIDYFKKYNDTYGHAAGDACLKAFGETLLNQEWDYQIEFYRYGGEEFVAFLWDVDSLQVGNIAEAIRFAIADLDIGYGKITSSIGYVYCDNPSILNYETWIERADEAAYAAKDRGRNCVAKAKVK